MNDSNNTSSTPAAGEAAKKEKAAEPENVRVRTTRKRVKIRNAIVSNVPNFLITRTEADELVAAGDVTIVEVVKTA